MINNFLIDHKMSVACKGDRPPDLFVDMHIDDLATFMFKKNVNNAVVELSLGGIENNKDMFFFCLDLFCKGLVMLYGENGRVNVENLSQENFMKVREKMNLAGIDVLLDLEMLPDEDGTTVSLVTDDDMAPPDVEEIKNSVNINELDQDIDDNKQLKDYVFKLKMDKVVFNIHFNLFHRTI